MKTENRGVTYQNKILVTLCVFFSVILMMGIGELKAQEYDPQIHQQVVDKRGKNFQKMYGFAKSFSTQVSDPGNVLPPQKMSGLFDQVSQMLTFVQDPMRVAKSLMTGEIMSGLQSMMGRIGGFGSGSFMPPLPIPSVQAPSSQDMIKQSHGAAFMPSAMDVRQFDEKGRLLAVPVVSLSATPIAAGGGSRCPPLSNQSQQGAGCTDAAAADNSMPSLNSQNTEPTAQ